MSAAVILEAKDISRTYHSSAVAVEALKRCTVSFRKGEYVTIVGKSGSGKSTLLHLLGTLDTPDTGEILLDGRSILNLSDNALSRIRRRKIGFVYQDFSLFPEYTAYENIILPIRLDDRRENPDEIADIMETLGITACRDRFPGEMSGGEQQRTAIARALAIRPAVILADEPTGNLDAQNSREVIRLLSEASKVYDQTIVMVTHDRQSADYADRILTIRDGVLGELQAVT
ncbi:MAG: ABC transporter ATP-binding protein [Lachnospiraceae bacterium]|nr:ABC transporter ATP-binding protein [Lachnospiraceae bacterium]